MEGAGGRIKENDKKNHERENFAEKIVHTEQPRKKFCIEIPKYLTEILAIRTILKLNTCLLSWLLFRADLHSKRHFNQ